jgi:hypothetical protein
MKQSFKTGLKITSSALTIPLLLALGAYSYLRPSRKPPPVPAKPPSETALVRAKKILDGKGLMLTWSDCDDNVCRSVEGVPKKDDGFVYRYDNKNGSFEATRCGYNKDSKVGDQNWGPMILVFKKDAEKKFSAMEFRAVSTFNTPGWDSVDYADGACTPTVSATFLLKAGGRLYSAKYTEKFSTTGDAGLREDVSDLIPIDKPPANNP